METPVELLLERAKGDGGNSGRSRVWTPMFQAGSRRRQSDGLTIPLAASAIRLQDGVPSSRGQR